MNIFFLDYNPFVAASQVCDKHAVKMIVESAQMLSTAHHILNPTDLDNEFRYKKTHANHPCNIWVRTCAQNYAWLLNHFLGLLSEYNSRYGKIHKSFEKVEFLDVYPSGISHQDYHGITTPVQCMPDQYKHENPVIAYQQYYIGEKMHFAKWKNGNIPEWVLPHIGV